MSEPVNGTRDQTPDDVQRMSARLRPVLAAGEPVPGLTSWILEDRLGGGGFGEVWLARHAWDREQKSRAVKFCTDPAARHRLVTHERNVVVRVMKHAGKHPNIVPLLECNLDGDIPWLMYEFVEGGTLAQQIEEWRGLPLPRRLGRAVRTLHAIAGALATCHRLDPPLVHRDMKPQNVLMAGNAPRITDFGIGGVVVLAKDDPATGGLTALAARLPSVLQSAGTRNYAPAEQLFGAPPNPRDDVYALGIIAYQMVLADLTTAPGADAALELRDLKVPHELASLIVRSVAINPERRPKDAAEWEAALEAIFEKAGKSSTATGTPALGSKPVVLDEGSRPVPVAETNTPRLGSGPVVLPEPTENLPPRHQPPPPRPPEFPAEPETEVEPVEEPASDEPERAEPKRSWKLAGLLAGVLVCVCLVAALVYLLPSGGRSEPTQPTQPTAKVDEPKGGGAKSSEPQAVAPKGASTDPPSGPATLKGGTPEPKVDPKPPKPQPKVEPKVPREPEAGAIRLVEIAPGVKVEFCYIPRGKAMLGSPNGEIGRFSDEMEHEFTSSGYWLGKYTVTQGEWKALMGTNPSYFDGDKDNKAKGMDTRRFPVERVSWDMICGANGFLEKANGHDGIRKEFGRPGKFQLPSEDQWEYAYRGGKGNKQAYYWGDELNVTQANFGSRLGRTCAVDFTNEGEYPAHPWGLMHMSGNVWQWCSNEYSKDRLVVRGGSWSSFARNCRGAIRIDNAPGDADGFVGFRLFFRLD